MNDFSIKNLLDQLPNQITEINRERELGLDRGERGIVMS